MASIETIKKISALICLLVLAGCAQQPIVEPALTNLSWPPSPASARIRFLQEIRNPGDVGIDNRFLKRFATLLKGDEQKTIERPYGLTVSSSGILFVVDNTYQAVHVFDRVTGRYHRFPSATIPNFRNPVNIALGSQGRIYVSDSASGRIHMFDQLGKRFLKSFGHEYLSRPTGIAFNPVSDELLVLDTKASLLLSFDESTQILKSIVGDPATSDDGAPLFHFPTNIAVTKDGTVYVTDSLNFRINILDSNLQFLSTFGSPGNAPGNFSRPKGIAVDSDNHVYVIDAIFDNIQVFEPTGELLLAIGGPGNRPGRFWLPNSIFIDDRDRIYVSDAYNERIQVFEYRKLGEDQ